MLASQMLDGFDDPVEALPGCVSIGDGDLSEGLLKIVLRDSSLGLQESRILIKEVRDRECAIPCGPNLNTQLPDSDLVVMWPISPAVAEVARMIAACGIEPAWA